MLTNRWICALGILWMATACGGDSKPQREDASILDSSTGTDGALPDANDDMDASSGDASTTVDAGDPPDASALHDASDLLDADDPSDGAIDSGPADECAIDNGGCDSLTTCTAASDASAPTCGACPVGYLGTGSDGCTPTLTGLTFSHGTLTPALSDASTDHAVNVGLAVETIALTASVPVGAAITVNGEDVLPDAPWTSPTLALGDTVLTIVVSYGEAARNYTITVNRGSLQQAYIKASNTGVNDHFGTSVAIDGDTLVVGAPNEDGSIAGVGGDDSDNGAESSGGAYVFVRSEGAWAQQAYLKASNAEANDQFGKSVAISGDTIAVGAHRESSNAVGANGDEANNSTGQSGAVYVFVRDGVSWTQQAYLKASNPGSGDQFGSSVALSGNSLVVGAWAEASNATGIDGDGTNNFAPQSGAAYVFARDGVSWTQQAYLKASNAGGTDFFGERVAISGDTVVVSASGEDGADGGGVQTFRDTGAAYVFVRNTGVWTQQAYLKADNADRGDFFGQSVAISGDTIVVGAAAESSNATGINGDRENDDALASGAAYIFVRTGASWSQQAYFKASNTESGDSFGDSVAISGDYVVVGALFENSNATGTGGDQSNNDSSFSGAGYLFHRDGDASWRQVSYLKASNTDPSDRFSYAVAVSGNTVVLSAVNEGSNAAGINGDGTNNSAPESGATYVFQ